MPEPKRRDRISRKKREEILTRFILTLSDQQLVTGLAILIGAIANRCTISVYEFNMVVALAWFSSTTHLATLGVLRVYFRDYGTLRNVRVIGIVSMLILLLFAVEVNSLDIGFFPGTPIQCVFSSALTGEIDVLSGMAATLTIMYLIFSYLLRILSLYRSDEKSGPARNPVSNYAYIFWHRRALKWQQGHGITDSDSARNFDVLIGIREVDVRISRIKSIRQKGNKYIVGRIERGIFTVRLGYSNSFLPSLDDLAFSLSYGFSQVVSVRWVGEPKLAQGANRWSFGQIVPLFLLALPVFAAAEIYYGIRLPLH